MQKKPVNLKRIVVFGVIALVLVSAVFLYISLSLHIVRSLPDPERYPSSLSVMQFEFSQPLDEEYIQSQFRLDPNNVIDLSFESASSIKISDRTLLIDVSEMPLPSQQTIELKNIRSKSGDMISKKIKLNIVSIPYAKMSDDEKRLFNEAAAEGEEVPNDPIVDILPYETDKYKITYLFPGEDVELPATIKITMKFFKPGDIALPATPAQQATYLEQIRKYRKEALDYLDKKGISQNKYILEYSEPDLRSEFPSGYTSVQDIIR